MAVLKKVKLYYPAFLKENKKSKKFQVNIGNLTKAHVKILVDELGVDAKQIKEPKTFTKKDDPEGKRNKVQEDQGTYIVARSQFPITVKNGKREELSEDEIKKIGNGSIANVQVNGYDWIYDGDTGISAGLQQVQMLKTEVYVGFEDEFADEEDDTEEADAIDDQFEDEAELD